MPSLLEALEEKYGLRHMPLSEEPELVSIFMPKLPPRVSVPELLVLNDCNIDKAGEEEDLKKKCSTVRELDLAQNKLENWDEVLTILTHMPRVEFVNLSLNRLYGPIAPPTEISLNKLKSLVLNNTHLEWESVDTLLNFLPVLEELHLSLNDYKNVLIDTLEEDYLNGVEELQDTDEDNIVAELDDNDPETNNNCTCRPGKEFYNRSESTCSNFKKTNAHEGVKKLHFTGNPVTDWAEICRLGRVFPSLESLVLAECPIRSLEAPPSSSSSSSVNGDDKETPTDVNSNSESTEEDPCHAHFRNLTLLNLSNSAIATWEDIDRLSKFPKLRSLRVQNWPLWEKCDSTEHERRQLLIARLPFITMLNGGGVIGAEEREDAERAFIRYYMDKPESERPARYAELVAVHGRLDPLVSIDLRPEKRVKVKFTHGETSEEKNVDVYRTVWDLRTRLEKMTGIPAAKMRLYYVDQDLREQGPEEMRYPHKRLYSYNIRSGDEIIIDRKN